MKIDEYKQLAQFTMTDKEDKYFAAMIEHGNQAKAARSLTAASKDGSKVTRRAIESCVERVKKRAQKRNFNPEYGMDKPLPDNFMVERITTHHKDGKLAQYWTKGKVERDKFLEQVQEVVEMIAEPIKGIVKPTKSPRTKISNLLPVYPIADAHLGMYAYDKEVGHNYDASIAKKVLTESMSELVESAPSTDTCLISNLADFFHADSKENKTMRSGHVLDIDSRWARVVGIGVKAYFDMIRIALTKHKTVIIKSAIGNHDDHSIMWLATVMQYAFASEPRVQIDIPVNPFAYHVFGKNLIGITHNPGKSADLPILMATDMPKEWGDALYRVWFTGHKHHKEIKEYQGCTVELFKSIAPNDAWAHEAKFRSGRSMECIVLEKAGGEHSRQIVNIR